MIGPYQRGSRRIHFGDEGVIGDVRKEKIPCSPGNINVACSIHRDGSGQSSARTVNGIDHLRVNDERLAVVVFGDLEAKTIAAPKSISTFHERFAALDLLIDNRLRLADFLFPDGY